MLDLVRELRTHVRVVGPDLRLEALDLIDGGELRLERAHEFVRAFEPRTAREADRDRDTAPASPESAPVPARAHMFVEQIPAPGEAPEADERDDDGVPQREPEERPVSRDVERLGHADRR